MTEEEFIEFITAPQNAFWLSLLALWLIVWKALALYRAGSNRSPGWFVALLVFNTVGILEILYFFGFSKRRKREMDARLDA